MMEKFYTIDEIAETLKVHASTIRRCIKSGELVSQKIGRQHRITETEFKRFLEKQMNGGNNQ
jgi:excisionase family DNA binding protein